MVENVDYCVLSVLETAADMQTLSVGRESLTAAVELKRTLRQELQRLIQQSSIVIARHRLRLLDVVGQGL